MTARKTKAAATKKARSPKVASPKAADMATYLISRKGQRDLKVTVPESWRVTFGPLVPTTKGSMGDGKLALRFYEGREHQRAVFTDVLSFRRTDIGVEELVVSEKEEVIQKATPEGMRSYVVKARSEEWRPADQASHSPHKVDHRIEDMRDDLINDLTKDHSQE